MNWYLEVLKKYVDFSGRARRTEYWMFVLFNVIISLVLQGIDFALKLRIGEASNGASVGILSSLYSLAVLLPSLGVSVRRLHDTGRSGWWLLLGFVPCVGGIALLVFMAQDSYPMDNQYGPNPKVATF